MPTIAEVITAVLPSLTSVDVPALINGFTPLLESLRDAGVKISGRYEMDVPGRDPKTNVPTAPANGRVILEFSFGG